MAKTKEQLELEQLARQQGLNVTQVKEQYELAVLTGTKEEADQATIDVFKDALRPHLTKENIPSYLRHEETENGFDVHLSNDRKISFDFKRGVITLNDLSDETLEASVEMMKAAGIAGIDLARSNIPDEAKARLFNIAERHGLATVGFQPPAATSTPQPPQSNHMAPRLEPGQGGINKEEVEQQKRASTPFKTNPLDTNSGPRRD
jgi:hypothetical protein